MLALDTNVLVRILVDDATAKRQCEIARATVAQATSVYVSQMVLVETAWVLGSAYGLSRAMLYDIFNKIANHQAFNFQNDNVFKTVLSLFKNQHSDFADCMILAQSAHAKQTLATFDKKLGRLEGCLLLC